MRHRAAEAAEVLAGEGICVEVIDPRTVAPLDTDTIVASVGRTGRLVCVQEARRRAAGASRSSPTCRARLRAAGRAPRLVAADPIPVPTRVAGGRDAAWRRADRRSPARNRTSRWHITVSTWGFGDPLGAGSQAASSAARKGSGSRRRDHQRRRVERLEACSSTADRVVRPTARRPAPRERRRAGRSVPTGRSCRRRTGRCSDRSPRRSCPRRRDSAAPSTVASLLSRRPSRRCRGARSRPSRSADSSSRTSPFAEERLVLEHQHGVGVADGGSEQAVGVLRRGGHDEHQARDVQKPVLDSLRVLGAEPTRRAVGHAHRRPARCTWPPVM